MSQDEGTTVNTEQPVTPAPVEPSPANPAPVTPAPVETPETPTPQPVDPAAQPEKPLEPVEQPKVTVNVEVPTESGEQQNSVNQAAGTPAATAIAMSKAVSPIITLSAGSARASANAASSMAGCGLDGWRSAVWSVTKWSERP